MDFANIIGEAEVLKDLADFRVPGCAIAVVSEGERVFTGVYGKADVAADKPITEHSLFGIASTSKAYTSALIATLVDEGLLDYDRPIRDFVPDLKFFDPVASEHATLRDLLYHRTGLSAHDGVWYDSTIDRAELAKRLRYLTPGSPFRSGANYNSVIYSLIGYVAEYVTGKSYGDLLRERFFGPLGLNDAKVSINEFTAQTDLAHPYYSPIGTKDIVELPQKNLDLAVPGAGLFASVSDMIAWVGFHTGDGTFKGKRIISEENFAQLHEPGVFFAPGLGYAVPEVPRLVDYAMGWFVDQYRTETHVWHAGEINGYTTFLGFLPEKKLGYVVISNKHKPNGTFLLSQCYKILDRALGYPENDWSSKFLATHENYVGIHVPHTFDLLEAAPVAGTKLSHPVEEYLGEYENGGYGKLRVSRDGDNFKIAWRGDEFPAQHYHYDVLKVSNVLEDVNWWSLPLQFKADPYTGKISKLAFELDPGNKPVIFERVAD
jgi:CubicO group peptidase (beta-lactamase class C family)